MKILIVQEPEPRWRFDLTEDQILQARKAGGDANILADMTFTNRSQAGTQPKCYVKS